jgi:energy-converting hydrogenase Eha subunit H
VSVLLKDDIVIGFVVVGFVSVGVVLWVKKMVSMCSKDSLLDQEQSVREKKLWIFKTREGRIGHAFELIKWFGEE